jgi:exopolysaccharide production protein ExoZ
MNVESTAHARSWAGRAAASHGRNPYLQYLRAAAASSVLLYHASYYLASMRGDPRVLTLFNVEFGNFGVVLFFAISGYLMAALAERSAAPSVFLAHRLVRIYPIYWLVAAASLLTRYLLNDGAVFDPFAFALIPGARHYYVLGVEWTLPFELTFYLIVFFIILIRAQRLIPVLATGWVASLSVLLVTAPGFHPIQGQFPTLIFIPLAAISLAFAAGLVIPFAIRCGFIGLGTVIFAVALLAGSEAVPRLQPWCMAFGCALLVASAVRPMISKLGGERNLGVALGDWSFALYLCHVPIVRSLYLLAPVSSSPIALWFAAVGAAFCGAMMIGRLDMALYGWLKNRVDRACPLLHIAIAASFLLVFLGFGTQAEVERAHLARLTNMGEAMGRQFQAVGATTLPTILLAANAMAWTRSEALHSNIDLIDWDLIKNLRIIGWVLDVAHHSDQIAVLVFYDGQFLGAVVPQNERTDVLKVFGVDGRRPLAGFLIQQPAHCRDNAPITLLVVTADMRYEPIALPTHLPKCGSGSR